MKKIKNGEDDKKNEKREEIKNRIEKAKKKWKNRKKIEK